MNSQKSVTSCSSNQQVAKYDLGAVQDRLAPGSMEKKMKLVEMIIHSMPKGLDGATVELQARSYAFAVSDLPEYHLRAVARSLVSGKAGVKWCPMPNELGIMVREGMKFDVDRLDRLLHPLNVIEHDEPLTDEEKARRKKHAENKLKPLRESIDGVIAEMRAEKRSAFKRKQD